VPVDDCVGLDDMQAPEMAENGLKTT
jgi:hypothetical protein